MKNHRQMMIRGHFITELMILVTIMSRSLMLEFSSQDSNTFEESSTGNSFMSTTYRTDRIPEAFKSISPYTDSDKSSQAFSSNKLELYPNHNGNAGNDLAGKAVASSTETLPTHYTTSDPPKETNKPITGLISKVTELTTSTVNDFNFTSFQNNLHSNMPTSSSSLSQGIYSTATSPVVSISENQPSDKDDVFLGLTSTEMFNRQTLPIINDADVSGCHTNNLQEAEECSGVNIPRVPKAAMELQYNITATTCEGSICLEDRTTRNCYCDDNCYFYGDCCYTMIEKLAEESNATHSVEALIDIKAKELENTTDMFRKELVSCIKGENDDYGFFMVSKCDSSLGEIYREQCNTKISSIYNTLPVDYLGKTGQLVTFKNVFCALCNGVSEKDIESWKIRVLCESTAQVQITENMTVDEISRITGCRVQPVSAREELLRRCYSEDTFFKKCTNNEDWTERSLCEAYIYPLSKATLVITTPENVYRNPHCAACSTNNSDVTDMTCVELMRGQKENGIADFDKTRPKPIDLQVIFDFQPDQGLVAKVHCGYDKECAANHVYDCVTETCKASFCPIGQNPVDGTCISESSEFDSSISIITYLPKDLSETTNNGYSIILEVTFELDVDDDDYVNMMATELLDNVYVFLDSRSYSSARMEGCLCILVNLVNISRFYFAEQILKDMYALLPSHEIQVSLRNYEDLNLLQCTDGDLLVDNNIVLFYKLSTGVMFHVPSLQTEVPGAHFNWRIIFDKTTGMVVVKLAATCFKRHFINCSMVEFGMDEVVERNESLVLINGGLVLNKNEFLIENDKVYVCFNALLNYQGFISIFEYMYMDRHRILSIVTSSISIISVIVIIMFHICTKRFRNIHGLNITALSFIILAIHGHLIGQSSVVSRTSCIVYAVSLHFFVLCMFVWLSVIGYDMTRLISENQILSRSDPVKRFVIYFIVSIVIPVFLVVVSGSLEFTNSSFKPAYGRDVCWLTNGKAIIAFVIAPIAVSLILNVLFFCTIVFGLMRRSKQTTMVRKSVQRVFFFVYLKLTIILGLTWITGIIGGFVRQDWLWMIHMVLNGLQGLSLLACSVVNARVVRKLRTTFKLSRVVSENDTVTTTNFN